MIECGSALASRELGEGTSASEQARSETADRFLRKRSPAQDLRVGSEVVMPMTLAWPTSPRATTVSRSSTTTAATLQPVANVCACNELVHLQGPVADDDRGLFPYTGSPLWHYAGRNFLPTPM